LSIIISLNILLNIIFKALEFNSIQWYSK